MVDVDFQIKDSNLSHTYDLECFSNRVDDLIRCHENEEERMKYVAPYFCFVQSSGMGKTKILFEYQEMSYKQKGVASFVVVIGTKPEIGQTPIFPILDLANVGPRLGKNVAEMTALDVITFRNKVAKYIFDTLDNTLEDLVTQHPHGNDIHKVALLFDESQYLLKKEFNYAASMSALCIAAVPCSLKWPMKESFMRISRPFSFGCFVVTSGSIIIGTGGSTCLPPVSSWDKYLQMCRRTLWPRLMQICLAMGMMDSDFRVKGIVKLKVIELEGQSKTWWSEKLSYLLSN
jgi:hypothetical protein